MRKPEFAVVLLMGFALLSGCAALSRLGSTAGGAALGSLAGPGGAAVGAAGGLLVADSMLPAPEASAAPETVWGLASKLLDQLGYFIFLFALIWLLTWLAPSPLALLKRWRARRPTASDYRGPDA